MQEPRISADSGSFGLRVGALALGIATLIAGSVALWMKLHPSDPSASPMMSQNAAAEKTPPSMSEPTSGEGIPSGSPHLAEAAAPSEAPPEKVQLLRQILKSRNDNDPRLDTELRTLNESDKAWMRKEFQTLAREDLNGRGTIVFLLGRNLRTPDDVTFLTQVLEAPPCQSLDNCSHESTESGGEHEALESGANVTLHYPELVTLRALDQFVASPAGRDPNAKSLRDAALHALMLGTRSPAPIIRAQAEAALARAQSP